MSPDRNSALVLDWARQRRLLVTLLLSIAVAFALYSVVDALRSVLTPVFMAWVIAYALDPIIDRFESRGVSRTLAIVIVLFVLMAAVVGFAFLIIPELINQIVTFTSRLPERLDGLRVIVTDWVEATFKVEVPATFDDVVTRFGAQLKNFFPRALGGATSIVEIIFTSTFTALSAFANLILIPLFAFFLLKDFGRHIAKIRRPIPRRLRPRVELVVRDVDRTMAGFFRGQLTVMLIQSTIYSIGLSALGVPLGAGIGILTGMLCFIPYLGQLTGLTLALVMCLLDYQSGMQIVGIIALYGTVNVLDGLVITPRVVGGQVGLSPIAVILALMVFGKLLGFVGVLLAVPFAAVFKILLKHGLEYYKTTSFFLGDGPPDRSSSLPPGPREGPSPAPAAVEEPPAPAPTPSEADVARAPSSPPASAAGSVGAASVVGALALEDFSGADDDPEMETAVEPAARRALIRRASATPPPPARAPAAAPASEATAVPVAPASAAPASEAVAASVAPAPPVAPTSEVSPVPEASRPAASAAPSAVAEGAPAPKEPAEEAPKA